MMWVSVKYQYQNKKFPTVRCITIRFESSSSIAIKNVKAQVKYWDQIPVDEQRLLFNGVELEDDKTLADYNIPLGSTLDLRLPSGGKMVDLKKDLLSRAPTLEDLEGKAPMLRECSKCGGGKLMRYHGGEHWCGRCGVSYEFPNDRILVSLLDGDLASRCPICLIHQRSHPIRYSERLAAKNGGHKPHPSGVPVRYSERLKAKNDAHKLHLSKDKTSTMKRKNMTLKKIEQNKVHDPAVTTQEIEKLTGISPRLRECQKCGNFMLYRCGRHYCENCGRSYKFLDDHVLFSLLVDGTDDIHKLHPSKEDKFGPFFYTGIVYRLGGIHDRDPNNDPRDKWMLEVAKSAVCEHNKRNIEGNKMSSTLVFKSVEKAWVKPAAGLRIYFILWAADESGEQKKYKAEVWRGLKGDIFDVFQPQDGCLN